MNAVTLPAALPYSGDHGDHGIDLEPHMARALDDVVECLISYARWPAPPLPCLRPKPARPIEFDLREWVNEHIDPAEMVDLYVSMISDFSLEHDTRRHAETSRVEAMLREELRDSNIVQERAEKLAEEARYDREPI